jgi:hypothetical protein
MSTKKGNRILTHEEFILSIERDLAEAKKIAALWDSSQDLLEALKYVKHKIQHSEHWWMDVPNKGGFDLHYINNVIAKAEGKK